MKVKVIKRYVDKHTKEMMEVGTVKDYPDERAEELIKHRYAVRAAAEIPKAGAPEEDSQEKEEE